MGSIVSYTKARIDTLLNGKVNVADAVSLSTAIPARDTGGGFAGSAATASRGDHSHPVTYGQPYPLLGATDHFWSYPVGQTSTSGNVSGTKGPLTPLPVPRRMTLQELSTRIGQAADAGSAKIALYASAANGLPTGAPLWTSPAITVTAVGVQTVTGINLTLEPGLYWLGWGSYGYTTTKAVPRWLLNPAVADQYLPLKAVTTNQADNVPGISMSGFNETTGAFPNLTGSMADFPTLGGGSGWFYALKADPA